MSASPAKQIIACAHLPGDAHGLLAAIERLAGPARHGRSDNSIRRRVELAHGHVIEAAERIGTGDTSEEAIRRFDAAMLGYTKRVAALCVKRKRKG